jgi:hypothetical protein
MVNWGVVNSKWPRGGQFGPAKGGHFEWRIQFLTDCHSETSFLIQ